MHAVHCIPNMDAVKDHRRGAHTSRDKDSTPKQHTRQTRGQSAVAPGHCGVPARRFKSPHPDKHDATTIEAHTAPTGPPERASLCTSEAIKIDQHTTHQIKMPCSFLRRSEAQASQPLLPHRRKSSKTGSKPNRRHPQRASTPIVAPATEITCSETQTLGSDPTGAATRSPPTTSWWTESVHNWMSSSLVAPNVACRQRYKFLRFVCLPWISGSHVPLAPSDTPR